VALILSAARRGVKPRPWSAPQAVAGLGPRRLRRRDKIWCTGSFGSGGVTV